MTLEKATYRDKELSRLHGVTTVNSRLANYYDEGTNVVGALLSHIEKAKRKKKKDIDGIY
ncbi:hypothetical protein LR48_Vigan618s001100 [Vigna angularis]|uniref:Uncharacterized protein n=1 Tax=Phaseolus angularis TaxID=3914 RepID=A0A0L9TFN6_PHAAN|nr:hypothetical protein LR48_Vigan618s001100 [Vigna angularis]